MGVYKLETISNDFDIVMKKYDEYLSNEMKEVAIKLIQRLPDNAARDMAISHLLYAAEFIKISIIKELMQDISYTK